MVLVVVLVVVGPETPTKGGMITGGGAPNTLIGAVGGNGGAVPIGGGVRGGVGGGTVSVGPFGGGGGGLVGRGDVGGVPTGGGGGMMTVGLGRQTLFTGS